MTGSFIQFLYSFIRKQVRLFATVNFDAAGAPTLEVWNPSQGQGLGSYSAAVTTPANSFSGVGIAGIASVGPLTGTSSYTFTLTGTTQRVIGVRAVFTSAADTSPTCSGVNITTAQSPVSTLLGSGSNTVTVQCLAGATKTKPVSCTGLFEFILDDSSAR